MLKEEKEEVRLIQFSLVPYTADEYLLKNKFIEEAIEVIKSPVEESDAVIITMPMEAYKIIVNAVEDDAWDIGFECVSNIVNLPLPSEIELANKIRDQLKEQLGYSQINNQLEKERKNAESKEFRTAFIIAGVINITVSVLTVALYHFLYH